MQNTDASNASCEGYLSGKRIILGVTGGVAAYKAAYIASALVQRGADVHVVMTEHATQLVGPATFWAITGNSVRTDIFEPPQDGHIVHVSLPESADLLLVAPATANIIGKMANGVADDLLSTMALVVRCPVIIAPAMNVNMWKNAFVVANLDRLRQHDYVIVEPEAGRLACGTEGVGRLAEPEQILLAVDKVLMGGRRDYAGFRMLVSAGPTREPIDPVRYITNRSSGKMGYAIAEAAARRGATVTLVSGPSELEPPAGVETIFVETVNEMLEAVLERVKGAHIFISAAAPADFTPRQAADQKVKKSEHWTLELDKAEDILAEVAERKGDTVLVGFAAETQNLEENAAAKLEAKKLDLIVANDVSPGSDVFGSDANQVTLISRTGDRLEWPRMSKREVANGILDYVKANLMED